VSLLRSYRRNRRGPRWSAGRDVKRDENEKVRILPSRLWAGSVDGSVALTGVVMAVLVLKGMNWSFCVHWPSVASALRREVLLNLYRKPTEPVTALLSGGSDTRPKTGPPIEPEAGAV
jgi:hypothetical protein